MSRLALSILLVSAVALNACSSNSSNNPVDGSTGDAVTDTGADAGGTRVTVSGVAAPFPLTAMIETAGSDGGTTATSFTQIGVAVVDPTVAIANPNAAPLAGGALDTSGTNCPSGACAWSLPDVDISTISIGLVGIVDDLRTPATSRLWVKTGTGIGSTAFINGIKASPMPITDRQIFGVSKAAEGRLAAFASAVLADASIVPGVLETRGFMIGTVVTATGAPVAGATVAPTATTVLDKLAVIYPNDTFSGVVAANTTAVHGSVLVVYKLSTTPTPVVAMWQVTVSGATYPVYTAGTSPGTAFLLLMPPG